ncbi:unnamed protein product [Clonostachys rosea f. rosea IK726]|uniref:Protein kinase domain-containing protein n=2 Tax=Bionectria ochroleuca TaxID=29856 RepID=A0A0B7K7Y1_BIOOC|nr:unnamed protein product [Clonostachys rosea f. rosea IK726]
MDPISAAGIGLGVTSLSLQVFSGCIKGYQMFIEMVGMPGEFEHLRTRLRIEQSRCLLWGEKIGLVEELLDRPHRMLQMNNNLVLDMLHQIQTTFRACIETTSAFDHVAEGRSSEVPRNTTETWTKPRSTFLRKTLAVWERSGRVAARLEWAMLKKDSFEKLVTKLVQYNDRIESFLDRSALEDLRTMQAQHNLALLQMTDRIDQIQNLIRAMSVVRRSPADDGDLDSLFSRAVTLVEEPSDAANQSVVSLAEFKRHHLSIEMNMSPGETFLIPPNDMELDGAPKYSGRQLANLDGQKVWLEWRESVDDAFSQKTYSSTVETRVKKLSAILAAPDRPRAFHSPRCLGYYRSEASDKPGYALVYKWPVDTHGHNADMVSLRELLSKMSVPPAFNTRLQIAKMLASSLLYLHAVDWIHKDVRSDSILFAADPDRTINLKDPIFSGFEFSRPALPEEVTVSHQFSDKHDLYRHPDLLTLDAGRSRKSHDIYSLGLVLAEIALWEPIEDIVEIKVRRKELKSVRKRMLSPTISSFLGERVGWIYADVVRDCIEGGQALDLLPEDDEEDPETGVRLSNALHERVIQKLESIRV